MSKNTINKKDNKGIDQNNFQPALFDLKSIEKKPIVASFTGEKLSTDGGLLMLRELSEQIGLIKSLAGCIKDDRHQGYVKHSIYSLMTQRVFQIAAGYEDANDCNHLKDDPILKICSDKLPTTGDSLASQPTMSRFENQLSRAELYDMAKVFAEHFLNSYANEPLAIILDCDDTNSNTYGEQQLALFNDYYGEYCYMPLHIYEGLSGKLITTILKPGRRSKGVNVYGILKRIIAFLRKSWKNTVIIVRGDSHFCSKELMDWAYGQRKVHFISGLTGNSLLNKLSEITIESAKKEYILYGKPVKKYHSFEYKAGSWQYSQRVIVKVEANENGTNIRYIVTDLRDYKTKSVYEMGYCARGSMELRIKDHKTYLRSDRMSCNSFWANQMRLFLHSAAYVLIHTLQKEMLKGTEYYNATMETIKLKIIKVATRVTEMKTKVKVEYPFDFPVKELVGKCFRMFEMLRC
jgi:hypothetical protein